MDFFAGFIYYRTSLDPCGIDLLSIDHTEDHTAIVNINKNIRPRQQHRHIIVSGLEQYAVICIQVSSTETKFMISLVY